MNRLLFATLAALAASLPAAAAACTPIWSGTPRIVEDTSPDCLAFELAGERRDGGVFVRIFNGCDVPTTVTCGTDRMCVTERERAVLEAVALARDDEVTLDIGLGATLEWSLAEASGPVVVEVEDLDWSDCGDPHDGEMFCRAQPGSGAAPGGFVSGLLVILALRRRRRAVARSAGVRHCGA